MFIAKVIGTVVSTCKEQNITGVKLLVVQDIHDQGTKKSMIATDVIGAGVGETVLVVFEGGSARQAINSLEAPINVAVVGIIDYPEQYEDKNFGDNR